MGVRRDTRRQKSRRKRIKKFDTKMQANVLLVFCVVILLFIILIGRIHFVMKEEGDRYEKRVLSQQAYVSSKIPFKRGTILDRNQTVLARSTQIYNVILDCKQILSKEGYKKETVEALTKTFDITTEELEALFAEKPKSQYSVIRKEQIYKKKEAFEKLQKKVNEKAAKKKNNNRVVGVYFELEYRRQYPLNTLACDVIGFTDSKGSQGIVGLENYYNEELIGTAGREYGYFDSELNLKRTVKPAVDGYSLVTTLDANIQQIVEKHIKKFNKDTGSKNTAVIIMNPQNGEIYAMTSEEQFDLNNPWDLSPFYPKKELEKMTDQEKSDALNKIWRNYCINDSYEPGSTFKPITVAAALEEGIVNEKKYFVCDGGEKVGARWIGCVNRNGHGSISLETALMKSCNDAMMQMGRKLGRKKFYQYQTNFGFGNRTGIDLPGEARGLIFSQKRLDATELATSSFGQGFTCTMLQIASANASLINGGYYYQPHLVKSIQNESGAIVKNIEPLLVKETVSSKTSQLIRQFLYETVENGTGSYAKVEGYEIGGKTGTAEKYPRGNKKYLVSFLGFTPVEKPEVLIYTIIDEPTVEEQDHSTYAQILSKDILQEILPFLNVHSKAEKTSDPKESSKPKETKKPAETEKPKDSDKKEEIQDPNSTQMPESVFGEEFNDTNDEINENILSQEEGVDPIASIAPGEIE